MATWEEITEWNDWYKNYQEPLFQNLINSMILGNRASKKYADALAAWPSLPQHVKDTFNDGLGNTTAQQNANRTELQRILNELDALVDDAKALRTAAPAWFSLEQHKLPESGA